MKTVQYTRTAEKELKRIEPKTQARIREKVRHYAADPVSLANKVTPLVGSGDLRLRVGDYRVIFTEDAVVLMVLRVRHRQEAYRP